MNYKKAALTHAPFMSWIETVANQAQNPERCNGQPTDIDPYTIESFAASETQDLVYHMNPSLAGSGCGMPISLTYFYRFKNENRGRANDCVHCHTPLTHITSLYDLCTTLDAPLPERIQQNPTWKALQRRSLPQSKVAQLLATKSFVQQHCNAANITPDSALDLQKQVLGHLFHLHQSIRAHVSTEQTILVFALSKQIHTLIEKSCAMVILTWILPQLKDHNVLEECHKLWAKPFHEPSPLTPFLKSAWLLNLHQLEFSSLTNTPPELDGLITYLAETLPACFPLTGQRLSAQDYLKAYIRQELQRSAPHYKAIFQGDLNARFKRLGSILSSFGNGYKTAFKDLKQDFKAFFPENLSSQLSKIDPAKTKDLESYTEACHRVIREYECGKLLIELRLIS